MASKNPSKTELVAICKLEFYRKQKNWKFCAPERKAKESKRRSKATNGKLNQTYSIAPAPQKEPPDPKAPEAEKQQNLDEAFVETETGTLESDEPAQEEQGPLKDVLDTKTEKPSSQLEPLGSPYSPRWSIQRWAEQHHLWDPEPPCPTLDPMCLSLDPTCPSLDPMCPSLVPTCPILDPMCPTLDPTCPTLDSKFQIRDDPTHDPACPQPVQDTNRPIFDNNYNTIQQDIYLGQTNSNYPNFDSNYPTHYPSTNHLEQFDPKYGASLFYYNSNMCYDFDMPEIGANVPIVRQSDRNMWDAKSGVDVLNTGGEWGDEWCAGEGTFGEPDWLAEAAALGGRGAGAGAGAGWGAGAGGEDAVDGDWRYDLSWGSGCASLTSVASSEFVRGAALAPHSTQIDLLRGPEPACALTGRALAAAVARHSAALRELLQEAQRRQQEPHHSPALHNYDEVPVRDPGPALYCLPPPPLHDPILAGSRPLPDLRGHAGQSASQGHAGQGAIQGHAGQGASQGHAGQGAIQGHAGQGASQGHAGQGAIQGQEGGRGRGRLKVGIRMGRPYRL